MNQGNEIVKEIMAEVKEKINNAGELKHVYFIACGGSKAALYPGFYFLQSEAKTFAVSTYTSNEFVHATPKVLDAQCIAVVCSLNATAESIEAAKVAEAAGAVTIAVTGSTETGMAKAGQYVVPRSGEYDGNNMANGLRVAIEILEQFEKYEHYDKAMDAFGKMSALVERSVETVDARAKEWAAKTKEESLFYVLASGPNYGVAYSMCCCHFMEMQWKHAVCMHTGEYFHGPFETTDKKLPMVLIMSEGRTRALDERCLKFLRTYAENFIILDFEELNRGTIDSSVAEFFNPLLMVAVERYYVVKLSEETGHSMDERRYMWKVEY